MKVLLTGGMGFIGTALVPLLANAEIVVIDNLHPQVHGNDPKPVRLPPNARLVLGDVAAPDTWRVLDDFTPDVVIHLAAETGTGQSLRESRRHSHVNVTGTATLLDALSARGHVPSTFVLTSSRAVYGEGHWFDEGGSTFPTNPRLGAEMARGDFVPRSADGTRGLRPAAHDARTVDPRPTNVYAATKLAQEHILRAWTTSFGANLIVLRLQNVYGAGQALNNPYTGVLTYLARQAIQGETLEIYESGGIIRDFVHVSDVARAITAALSAQACCYALDIGSGRPVALEEVAELLVELSGGRSRVVLTPRFREGDVRAAFADNGAAAEALGYVPSVDLRTGLSDLIGWVKQ